MDAANTGSAEPANGEIARAEPANDETVIPEPVNAKPVVTVSSDGMEAELSLSPPENGGSQLTAGELRAALEARGVVYGIMQEVLDGLEKHPDYNRAVTAAKGVAAVDGTPAELIYKVQLGKDLKPRENPDGTVDYKDLGIVQNVMENDVLCEKIPAGEGTPGCNILGVALKAKPGRDYALPMGKNTKMSGDQLQLLAACDGQVDMVNQKLQILNTFTVRGDVCNATGNIDFVGNLTVNGNVLTGFSVQAAGNITVNGCVEGAVVTAGGNIVIKEGINGSGQGGVQAGGYVKTKYIQSGNVRAGGDIETTFIQHSNVQSGGSVNLAGNKGTLAGGKVIARNSINAVFAGGRNSPVPTFLEVGTDPASAERRRQLEKQIETDKNQRSSLAPAIAMLEEIEKNGGLSADRKEALEQAKVISARLADELETLGAELEVLNEETVSLGYGTVNIKQSVYPGVRIVIGPEQILLETKYDNSTFMRGPQGITFSPYR